MDTQFFNSPLLGSLSLDSPVSSATPKRKSSSGSPPSVSSKRSRNMHSLTPSDFVPRSLKWDSDDSCDSGFASFGSTSYALNFDLDGDIPDENDIEMVSDQSIPDSTAYMVQSSHFMNKKSNFQNATIGDYVHLFFVFHSPLPRVVFATYSAVLSVSSHLTPRTSVLL
jgi:hypothetical protein